MIEKHTLDVLDFFKIIDQVKKYSHFYEGLETIEKIRPADNYQQAVLNLTKTTEVIQCLGEKNDLWQIDIPAISVIFKRLSKINGVLNAKEVAVFLIFLPIAHKLRQFFKNRPEAYPVWSEQVEQIADFTKLQVEVENLVDDYGKIKDSASATLSRIRRELVSTQYKIKEILQSYLQSSNLTEVIAEKIITQRNSRYVIPVVRGKEKVLRGIVQDVSKSGASVFVEPEKVLPLNNLLISLTAAEIEEIALLLAKISDILRYHLKELTQAANVLAEFDSFYARARLSEMLNTTPPQLNREGFIKIIEGKHPILIFTKGASAVIPQTIEVGREYRTLVITGPNTGGKTVALKMTGLLTLMALSGMYISAKAGSEIPVLEKIYADIGDEQSLEQSLSTFSAHMTYIVRVIKEAAPNTLYLMDELGAGTDPTEGAALAVSITERLHNLGAITLVATHFRLLKNYAAEHEEMQNASVEFNETTLLPTYHIKIGFLGSSRAIETARRLGLEEEVIQKALPRLGGAEFKIDQLLVKLENENRQQEFLKQELAIKERQIKQLQEEWEERNKNLKEFSAARRKHTLQETKELLTATRQEIAQALEKVRKEEKSAAIKSILQEVEKQEKEVVREIEKIEEPLALTGNQKVKEWEINDLAYIKSLRLTGKIISLSPEKKTAQLECGDKLIEISLEELIENDKPLTSTFKELGFSLLNVSKEVEPELNLIGKRLEEALGEVDKYLDKAILSGLTRVYIIHGVGGEVLRKNIANLLAEHPQVKSFQAASVSEGGIGVTIVELDV